LATDKPSKSAKKREYLALQALGERLVGLPEGRLRELALDEALFDAITAAASMTSHGALRRQRQLIGKLMRNTDPEPIRRALEALQRQENEDKQIFRQAEHWRDQIVQHGRDGLNEFFRAIATTSSDLSTLLDDYLECRGDTAQKTLRKKIFRAVYRELTVRNDAR
jgi:ribosome-associated protein